MSSPKTRPRLAHLLGGDEAVDAAAGTEVEHGFAGAQVGQSGGVAAAGGRRHRFHGQALELGFVVQGDGALGVGGAATGGGRGIAATAGHGLVAAVVGAAGAVSAVLGAASYALRRGDVGQLDYPQGALTVVLLDGLADFVGIVRYGRHQRLRGLGSEWNY